MRATIATALLFLCDAAALAADRRVEDVSFVSHGETLSGSIVFPAGGETHSAVVLVHGSGRQERNVAIAKRFANDGIAALVYDKRGTGRSGGSYEAEQNVGETNLALLADDAAEALKTLSRHPDLAGVRLGLAGISQAGWIVPLAAEDSDLVDFIVLWSGPVCGFRRCRAAIPA